MRVQVERMKKLWRWSVWQGAQLLRSGICRSETAARAEAETFVTRETQRRG